MFIIFIYAINALARHLENPLPLTLSTSPHLITYSTHMTQKEHNRPMVCVGRVAVGRSLVWLKTKKRQNLWFVLLASRTHIQALLMCWGRAMNHMSHAVNITTITQQHNQPQKRDPAFACTYVWRCSAHPVHVLTKINIPSININKSHEFAYLYK